MKIEHIYIISLDTSDEFVNSAVDKLNKSNLPNKTGYTIMPAVNGINDIIHRDNVRKFGVSLYENWKLQNTDKEFWAREMSVGEIGCVLSHINVWKDAYKNGYGNVLILEEDFEPSEIKDNKLIWNILDELNSFDGIFFGTKLQTGSENQEVGLNSFLKAGFVYNAHAYILSKKGVCKIVETNLNKLMDNLIPTDEFLPATFTKHLRKDIDGIFETDMNVYVPKHEFDKFFSQNRHPQNKNSTTNPVEGIDY